MKIKVLQNRVTKKYTSMELELQNSMQTLHDNIVFLLLQHMTRNPQKELELSDKWAKFLDKRHMYDVNIICFLAHHRELFDKLITQQAEYFRIWSDECSYRFDEITFMIAVEEESSYDKFFEFIQNESMKFLHNITMYHANFLDAFTEQSEKMIQQVQDDYHCYC